MEIERLPGPDTCFAQTERRWKAHLWRTGADLPLFRRWAGSDVDLTSLFLPHVLVLRRLGDLGTAEPGQELIAFVGWGDNLHNFLIFKEVKYVCGQLKFRFVFGLVGHSEHFFDGFGAGNDRLDHLTVGGDIDGLGRLHRESFA